MCRNLAVLGLMIGLLGFAVPAQADTVECRSRNYQYTECWAGSLRAPHLVHQKSSSACIVNRTWGFNRRSGYIWVADGCQGVFADVRGYHHGRGDTFDDQARVYDHHGHDVGPVVAGAVLGALVTGAVMGARDQAREERSHTTSNHDGDGYVGCHGVGCVVDDPDAHPDFDKDGHYQGCHGLGCIVDDPDRRR